MILACSACATRFPAGGYRDPLCPSCGAVAQPPAERPCPRCELPLLPRAISDLVVDECSKCLGMFLDHVAIKSVLEDRELARAKTLLAALPRHPHRVLPRPGERMYIKCPSCGTVMNRKLFATGARVVVDVCRAHGMFFDAGELPDIIEFVLDGGLEHAAREQAERKLEHKFDTALSAARARDPGLRGNALVELLLSLFH